MMEDWIKTALDKAEQSSDRITRAERVMRSFMDKHSTKLVDAWTEVEEGSHVEALFSATKGNDKAVMAIRSLCAQFFINGYMIGTKDK